MLEIGVANGRITRSAQGVYSFAGNELDPLRELAIGCAIGGRCTAVSIRAAAHLHRLPGGILRTELSVRRWRRSTNHGWIIHESMDLGPADITMMHGLPVTTVPRTLIDLGTKVPDHVLDAAVNHAIRHGMTTIDEIAQRHAALARRGRDGVGPMRDLLDHRAGDPGIAESVLESRVLLLMRNADLPTPTLQHQVLDHGVLLARIDAAYVDLKIGIEADGEAYHSDRRRFVRDRERRNRLEALGWSMLGITWAQVRDTPDQVIADIRALRRQRTAQLRSTSSKLRR